MTFHHINTGKNRQPITLIFFYSHDEFLSQISTEILCILDLENSYIPMSGIENMTQLILNSCLNKILNNLSECMHTATLIL
jgi:hypothetical protein